MSDVCEIEENVIQIDAKEFTDIEKELILQVVARDEDVRIQEQTRLDSLKEELRNLREMGVPNDDEVSYGRVCKRCRTPLGFIFNSGAFCPSCGKKVCKECRTPLERIPGDQANVDWTCTVCRKFRDIWAESGAWFYSGHEQPTVKKKKIYGSMMLKKIFSVAKQQDYLIYKDPVWDEIVQDEPIEELEDERDDYLLPVSKGDGNYELREVPLAEIRNAKANGHCVEEVIEENVIQNTFAERQSKELPETASLFSNHSEDGDGKPSTTLAGEIQIGLRYGHNEKVFEVQIHRAIDLLPAGMNKYSSDPYVKVYLTSAARSLGKKKTKAKKDTLSPEFDEVLSFDIEHEELVTCTCSVSVWHYEFSNNNVPLGEVDINIEEFLSSGFSLEYPIPQWHTLYHKRSFNQMSFCGELVVSLEYRAPGSLVADTKREQRKLPNPTKGEFYINLIQAKGLESDDDTFYCKISLVVSDANIGKMKSKVVSASTDPYWDEDFTVNNISWSELEASYLQISVRGGHKNSVFIGGTRLGLGKSADLKHDSFGEEVRVWQSMLDHTNELQDFCIPLRNRLDSVKQDIAVPGKQVKEITDKEYDALKNKITLSSNLIAKRFLNADAHSLASSGSLLSIYSNAGGQSRNLVIAGEILFSIKHDTNANVFSVHIEKAKCIAAVNAKQQTSEPYCKLYLLPDPTKTTKKKTMHRRKTVNPQWNETVRYNISREELLKKTLQISIWNHDRFGRNDFLGEVQVNIHHYSSTNDLDTQPPVWYTLQEMAPVSVGSASENKGELTIGIRFDHEILSVHVTQANGLYAVDPDKLPNPFVKCYLLPDKSRKCKRKTSVQKKTITPVWEERFDYKGIEVGDLYSRVLEVTVWDHNTSGHQFLGGLRLGLPHGDEYWHDCFGKEVNIWESMMKHLGILAEYAIPLRATMTSRKGQITQEFLPSSITPITEEYEPIMSITSDHLAEVPIIRVSLQYVEAVEVDDATKKKKKAKGSLKVHLKEAKNLPIKYEEDVPSTFCKGFMHPKKKSHKMKTETYIKSANPIWDTEMSFDGVTLEELRTRVLEIVVFDEINEKDKEMIGFIRLGSGAYFEKWDDSSGVEVEIWRSMLNNPTKSIMIAVPLRITQDTFTEVQYYDDEYDEEDSIANEENEEADVELVVGNESPRTAALRAMGVYAADIITDMSECDECDLKHEEDDQHNEYLSPIVEEQEVRSVPEITITHPNMNDVIKPGEPPFVGAGMDSEDDLDDYKFKQDKKKPPKFSLLKRSTSQESITSIYSTDSANVYGHVPIRGDIQFGMKYDFSSTTFEVHIFQAKDISSVDTNKEISNPYCKVYLLPDKTKSGKKKTTTRRKTLNPEWEEILEFSIPLRDLRTRTLWVALWHLERFGRNIFLGEVMLNMDSIIDGNDDLETSTPKWYPLDEKGRAPVTNLYKGEIKFSIIFEDMSIFSKEVRHQQSEGDGKKKKKKKTERKGTGKINIHVKECYDLPPGDRDGFSDPFCKCYLLPTKSAKSKRKTPTIEHTMNPKWDYKFEYNVDYEDLADHGIEFSVWDWDLGTRNDFLGCCRINLGTYQDQWNDGEGVEIEAWEHLIDHPNTWKEFVIPLRSKLDAKCPHTK